MKHAPRGRIKARDGDDHPVVVEDPVRARCTAHSKRPPHHPCKQFPIPGGTVCKWHGGSAPQVKQKAIERLMAFQDPALDRLIALVKQEAYPSTSMSAVNSVLDRTMGKPAESVHMEVSGSLDIVGIIRSRAERRKLVVGDG